MDETSWWAYSDATTWVSGSAVVRVDPEAPRYRPVAGPGVELEEIASGLHVVTATDEQDPDSPDL